eukprot:m.131406 g.131406  ORF g.131406 m.131406 type:complete len:353 (+) comp29544_c1_seq2:248-1306(+)
MQRSVRSVLQWKSLQLSFTRAQISGVTSACALNSCSALRDRTSSTADHFTRQLQIDRFGCNWVTTTRGYATNLKNQELHLDQQYTEFVENKVRELQGVVRENHQTGRYGTALEAANECVDVVERHYGPSHPVYASSLNNVALLNKALGNLTLATELYEATVRAYVDIVGIDHPNTGVAMHNLALCLKANASLIESKVERLLVLEQAKVAFDDAIACHQKVMQRNTDSAPTNLVLSQINLASVLRDLGDVDKAENMLLDSLTQIEAHPDQQRVKATVLNNLGYHYRVTERPKQALVKYNEAWEIRSEILHPAHPDSIACLHNLAEVFAVLGETEMETQIRKKILDITQQHSES